MGDYVYSKQIGKEDGVRFELDIFKESNTEYRPIVTANDDEGYNSGFSERRSFKTEKEALNFFNENEPQLLREAKSDMLRR
jgi:hypothetical protein